MLLPIGRRCCCAVCTSTHHAIAHCPQQHLFAAYPYRESSQANTRIQPFFIAQRANKFQRVFLFYKYLIIFPSSRTIQKKDFPFFSSLIRRHRDEPHHHHHHFSRGKRKNSSSTFCLKALHAPIEFPYFIIRLLIADAQVTNQLNKVTIPHLSITPLPNKKEG